MKRVLIVKDGIEGVDDGNWWNIRWLNFICERRSGGETSMNCGLDKFQINIGFGAPFQIIESLFDIFNAVLLSYEA